MYVRTLSPVEQAGIEAGLRSSHAFTLRRSQILLASSRGQRPAEIARNLRCATQTVRNTIHAFEQARCEGLRAILHQRPQVFGKTTSLWTLQLASHVCFEQGLTEKQVSIETIRQALKRLGALWQQAKQWITSPDPEYVREKNLGWQTRLEEDLFQSRQIRSGVLAEAQLLSTGLAPKGQVLPHRVPRFIIVQQEGSR